MGEAIPDKPAGFVYLIGETMPGRVKIGYAKDPEKRLATLQTSTPNKLHLLAAVPGTKQTERELHEIMAGDRIRGEWFIDRPELREWFERRS